MFRLYHVPLSPFCRKVRLSLAEKKIEVELVEERYWDKSAEFLRRNPAGKLPVLKVGDEILSESTAICEYLEEEYPDKALLPDNPKERFEARRLVSWFDDKFHNSPYYICFAYIFYHLFFTTIIWPHRRTTLKIS